MTMNDTEIRAEEFRPVVGYEGLYEISDCGRIRNLGNGDSNLHRLPKVLKPFTSNGDYLQIRLSRHGIGKFYRINRLVAFAFIPNPNNLPEVNHKNRKKKDNRVENLEWCTRRYNEKHKRAALPKTSSRYTGVSWDKRRNKWAAYIGINGGQKWLGYFMDEKRAAKAYRDALAKLTVKEE